MTYGAATHIEAGTSAYIGREIGSFGWHQLIVDSIVLV
jgi:hypothetical protein